MVGRRKKNPESWPARMLTRVTFGATPAIPSPLRAPAIVPATWVPWPWPLSSSSAGSTQEGMLAGSVDEPDVGGEVAAQLAVEVRLDVGVAAVDAGVDDAYRHPGLPFG
jgi:hypothetical protein